MKFNLNIKRFSSQITRIKTFTNDEKTRTFLAFEVDELNKYHEILKSVNNSLKSLKFPTYYKVSSDFHKVFIPPHYFLSFKSESFNSC